MPVDFQHAELRTRLADYYDIQTCIDGERAVKREETRHLPNPNPTATDPKSQARYANYLRRAVFYNVTGRTHQGLLGQLFLRDPVVEKPNVLDVLDVDADGNAVPLNQIAQRAASFVVAKGRAGLLVDYPMAFNNTNDAPEQPATYSGLVVAKPVQSNVVAFSKQDVTQNNLHPIFTVYKPEDIINWRTDVINGERKLVLVVLRDSLHSIGTDGFSTQAYTQYKVLRMDMESNNHVVELWNDLTGRMSKANNGYTPLSGKGIPFTEIPFTFIGSENNDTLIDKPPILDIATLNLSMYRNSADYEESCFRCGQPTLWASGIDDDWITNNLKGSVVIGTDTVLTIPAGEHAGLLVVPANTMPREAMQDKIMQMAALGAKLVINTSTQKTATQTIVETTSEVSVLAQIATNIGTAFEKGLQWACQFMNVPDTEIKYEVNKDYDFSTMDANTLAQIYAAAETGYLSWTEVRTIERKMGFASLDDDAAQKEIDADQQQKQTQQLAVLKAQAAAQPKQPDNPQQQQQPQNEPGTKPNGPKVSDPKQVA
jgi:hypothetical protein